MMKEMNVVTKNEGRFKWTIITANKVPVFYTVEWPDGTEDSFSSSNKEDCIRWMREQQAIVRDWDRCQAVECMHGGRNWRLLNWDE